MDTLDKVMLAFACVFGIPLAVMGAYALFVYVPVLAYTESKCLEAGYPRASVTVDLDRYCMNLEGAVTVEVKELR